jgi:hypothetical protein
MFEAMKEILSKAVVIENEIIILMKLLKYLLNVI